MLILIALVTLCLAVSAVSAWEFSFGSSSSSSSSVSTDGDVATVDYKDGVLKINDKQFKIPNGYTQDNNFTQTGVDANMSTIQGAKMTRAAFDSGNNTIIVKYVYVPNNEITYNASANGETKTINGHTGAFKTQNDTTVVFTYGDNGKLIEINAPDEATLNEILK